MFSRKVKRKASLRNVSNDGGLSASLLAGDVLQMAPTHHQPKSFFNNDDEEETKSESTATVAEEETFESVGYGWDLVIIIPIPQQEEIGQLERSHEHDEVRSLLLSFPESTADHHGSPRWRAANLSFQFHCPQPTHLQSPSIPGSPEGSGWIARYPLAPSPPSSHHLTGPGRLHHAV
jgi:hypothetical protein